MPSLSAQKAREQEIGKAFIEQYNEVHKTDYALDSTYNGEFPDLRFKSLSESHRDLLAEVVQVIESEKEKAKEKAVSYLQRKIRSELLDRECKGLSVTLQYTDLPRPQNLKSWIYCVANYAFEKFNDLKRIQFKFDRAKDGRVFWEMSHIKTSIRSLQIKLLKDFDGVAVFLVPSQARRVFPEGYLFNAIQKKSGKKYAPSSIMDVTLLLDCDFSAIDEADMEEFSEHARTKNPGFKEIWCVNILANRIIVAQLV